MLLNVDFRELFTGSETFALLPKLIQIAINAHFANPDHPVAIQIMSAHDQHLSALSEKVEWNIPVEMRSRTFIILPALLL